MLARAAIGLLELTNKKEDKLLINFCSCRLLTLLCGLLFPSSANLSVFAGPFTVSVLFFVLSADISPVLAPNFVSADFLPVWAPTLLLSAGLGATLLLATFEAGGFRVTEA